MPIDKSRLTEPDIIFKFILPDIKDAGWDDITQIRQEVKLRDGKVVVRGQAAARKKVKSAHIILYHKHGLPLAVVEAKANQHEMGKGMQQALDYARLLDVPFAFASNSDGFIFHDKTNPSSLETEIRLEDFPSPEQLWQKLCQWKGYTEQQLPIITQDYYDDDSGKSPHYYQPQAINIAREVTMLPVHPKVSGAYLVIIIASPFFWKIIESNLKGIAYKGLNLNTLRDLAFPLPPVEEQHRIVTKEDRLMTLCDQIKTHLQHQQQTCLHLADALAQEALS